MPESILCLIPSELTGSSNAVRWSVSLLHRFLNPPWVLHSRWAASEELQQKAWVLAEQIPTFACKAKLSNFPVTAQTSLLRLR